MRWTFVIRERHINPVSKNYYEYCMEGFNLKNPIILNRTVARTNTFANSRKAHASFYTANNRNYRTKNYK